jgi:NitT/TauT family transport system ATP-binding protein
MSDSPFLNLSKVNYTFSDDGTQVFSAVSLAIRQGAFVVLVGASGIGKSTLLRVIGGLLSPTGGEVLLDGKPPAQARTPIGIVFQKDNLMPWRTAYDNVRLPLELRGENGRASKQRVQDMLDLVGLTGFGNNYPAQLSGGMAQRVAIARALIHKPALLLLDEPFGALDALTRERMGQELLRIWQAMPVTVFMVTHSIDEAVFLADEVLVMGSISGDGLPATITHRFPISIPRPRQFNVRRSVEFQECEVAIRKSIQAEK